MLTAEADPEQQLGPPDGSGGLSEDVFERNRRSD